MALPKGQTAFLWGARKTGKSTYLKINFPESHIVFLTKERFKNLAALFDGVDEVVCLPDNAGMREYYRLLNRLDNYNFDTVVDLHGNFRSWLASKMVTSCPSRARK